MTAVQEIFRPPGLFFSRKGFISLHYMLPYTICFHETVRDKWYLDQSVGQTGNYLERGFVKHCLNSV